MHTGIITGLLSIGLVVSVHAGEAERFHLAGDITELTPVGEMTISRSGPAIGQLLEIGVFSFTEGEIDLSLATAEPEVVWIGVDDANGKYVGKTTFVLEPGTFTIDAKDRKMKVRGDGPLNKALFAWQEDARYLEHMAKSKVLYEEMKVLPESEQEAFYLENVQPVFQAAEALKSEALIAMAMDDSKPVLARLAIMERAFSDRDEARARLKELDKLLGPSQVVNRYLARMDSAEAALKQADNFGVGKKAADFTIPQLNGELLTLSDVLVDNEYVLLEFWAVWCAPCRAEIPHMKRAYAEYSDKGFEIVSVSLDDNREDWEELSEEENIPWFNTCDLLFYDSPVVKGYGVVGIPKNYLVDSNMMIVAEDLRQEKLDEALAEWLGSQE